MYSMCQEARVCRGSAWNENLESLQADWKRKTISHCNLIPLLELLPNQPQNSVVCTWSTVGLFQGMALQESFSGTQDLSSGVGIHSTKKRHELQQVDIRSFDGVWRKRAQRSDDPILLRHMDDVVGAGSEAHLMSDFEHMKTSLYLTDVVVLRHEGDTVNFSGLAITLPRKGFEVKNSTDFVESLLNLYGLQNSKPTVNPGRRSEVMELASPTPLDGHDYSNFRTHRRKTHLHGTLETRHAIRHPTTIHTSPQPHDRASAQWNSWYDISKARNTLVFVLNRAKWFKQIWWNSLVVNCTPLTSLFMQCTRVVWCTSHCMAQVLVHASSHPHSHPCHAPECLFVLSLFLHLFLFRVFLLSLLLLPEPGLLPLPLPCGLHRCNIPLALHQMRSLALWAITLLSQVMSPTSSKISTTQRLLKSSSRSNPATPGLRTCMTRRSMTTPSIFTTIHSGARRNQRAVDKLITLLKKVCCQVSRCLSVM